MFEYLTRRLDDQERAALRELMDTQERKWFVYGCVATGVTNIVFTILRGL